MTQTFSASFIHFQCETFASWTFAPWWCHDMEVFVALLTPYEGNAHHKRLINVKLLLLNFLPVIWEATALIWRQSSGLLICCCFVRYAIWKPLFVMAQCCEHLRCQLQWLNPTFFFSRKARIMDKTIRMAAYSRKHNRGLTKILLWRREITLT